MGLRRDSEKDKRVIGRLRTWLGRRSARRDDEALEAILAHNARVRRERRERTEALAREGLAAADAEMAGEPGDVGR